MLYCESEEGSAHTVQQGVLDRIEAALQQAIHAIRPSHAATGVSSGQGISLDVEVQSRKAMLPWNSSRIFLLLSMAGAAWDASERLLRVIVCRENRRECGHIEIPKGGEDEFGDAFRALNQCEIRIVHKKQNPPPKAVDVLFYECDDVDRRQLFTSRGACEYVFTYSTR